MKNNSKAVRIDLKNVGKKYEGRTNYTLEDINIAIEPNDFVVILGPSGCGKTTLLRMIAGLNSITKGDLLFDNKRVNELEPSERGIAMVFQSYALYPHMSVYENIAFGLKIRKERKDIIDQRVKDVAAVLDISEYLYNKPKDLSGGQQQRVAIGRAIARKPSVFLMDEPLSNLDAKLREKMRKELVRIHKMINTTSVYVTHDQLEAMTMATKIILLNKSKIQQIGGPLDLYKKPANLFTAKFIGSPTMNIVEGKINGTKFISNDEQIKINLGKHSFKEGPIYLGFRSENITITPNDDADFRKEVLQIEILGKEQTLLVGFNEKFNIAVTVSSSNKIEENKEYSFKIDRKEMHFFDKKTEERLN